MINLFDKITNISKSEEKNAKTSFRSNALQKALIEPAATLAVALPMATPALIQERGVAMPQ